MQHQLSNIYTKNNVQVKKMSQMDKKRPRTVTTHMRRSLKDIFQSQKVNH